MLLIIIVVNGMFAIERDDAYDINEDDNEIITYQRRYRRS